MPYRIDTIYIRKDPGPKGPALVHPAGVIWVIAFASSDQVSAILSLRNCEFRNLGIIGILSLKFSGTIISQFLNPLIPESLNP